MTRKRLFLSLCNSFKEFEDILNKPTALLVDFGDGPHDGESLAAVVSNCSVNPTVLVLQFSVVGSGRLSERRLGFSGFGGILKGTWVGSKMGVGFEVDVIAERGEDYDTGPDIHES